MSSGVVKSNYQNVPKINLPIGILFKFDKKEGQKCKFQFISELVSMLFKNKFAPDVFKNLSKLITLSLKEPSANFADVLFTGNNGYNFNEPSGEFDLISDQAYDYDKKDYLLMLNRVRSIFNQCSDLTFKQKYDFCSIERYFMKLFLKK
ncbi:MAG: hypothetical protein EU535_01070 [Promethearchaeota archaeon]|nr:MAG: hypothetical protein EU535_01070 [Candidatus Lokiarchaeota archaeon]